MEKLNVGDSLDIHCYKHNGQIHRTWNEAIVLDTFDDLLVCGNYRAVVTEKNGRTHKNKETNIIYFYKNNWYNVFAQFRKKGVYYKCNIASPYLIDDNVIKFIDYDLDLKVFPDGGFKVLDKNEYKYHKKLMNYSVDLDKVLNSELNELINTKKREEGPFNKEEISSYHSKLLNLIEKNKKSA